MKPETGANGIRSSACPPAAGAGLGPGARLRGMQRLCHGLILAPLCSENNPEAAAGGKMLEAWPPHGLFLIKVCRGWYKAPSSAAGSRSAARGNVLGEAPRKVGTGGGSPVCRDLTRADETRMRLPLPLPLPSSPTSHQRGGCCVAPHQGTACPGVSKRGARSQGRGLCVPCSAGQEGLS